MLHGVVVVNCHRTHQLSRRTNNSGINNAGKKHGHDELRILDQILRKLMQLLSQHLPQRYSGLSLRLQPKRQ